MKKKSVDKSKYFILIYISFAIQNDNLKNNY